MTEGASEVEKHYEFPEEVLNNSALWEFVQQTDMSRMASIQTVVSGLVKIMEDPRANAKDLKEVIEVDPPLTAKVLRHANSAALGTRHRISEVDQAVIWIGFESLKELALSQKVCEAFNDQDDYKGFSRANLWKHSVATALLAKKLYRCEFGLRGENMYVAGLMHDMGLIVMDQFEQETFRKCLDRFQKEKKALLDIEAECFGFNHIELGMAIVHEWNLSGEMVEAIYGQMAIDRVLNSPASRMGASLYLANYLVQKQKLGYCDRTGYDLQVYKKILRESKINLYSLEILLQDVMQEMRLMEVKGLF